MTLPATKPQTVSKGAKIVVLYGGLSQEREVSLRSGKNCYEALQRLGYTHVTLVDVDRHIGKTLEQLQPEVAFLALHGQYGEDGCIQGLLELMGIAYTGNNLLASALTMNKDITKRLLKEAGLPVLPSITLKLPKGLSSESLAEQLPLWTQGITFPVMVKPASEGSSIGMTKVNTRDDLLGAIETARQYDSILLLETYLTGRSLTVGVFEKQGVPTVTPILELRTKTEWYDYTSKYTEGLTEFILPAEIEPSTTEAIQNTTLTVHESLGCSGVSRTDFILAPDGRFYILEVNTIPGMTNLSDLPAQAKAMGVSYDELVDCLLHSALTKAGRPAYV